MAGKKTLSLPVATRRSWVEPDADYSIRRQCTLAGVPRSRFYHKPASESADNLALMRLIDWRSRYVLAWELSNTLEGFFCVAALEQALERGRPEIFNTDQGSQFTSEAFTKVLLDNVFIERLWWTLKYEEIYPKDYADGSALHQGLDASFDYYNHERKHSALDKRTPAEVFSEGVS